jgi:hypothetical protein
LIFLYALWYSTSRAAIFVQEEEFGVWLKFTSLSLKETFLKKNERKLEIAQYYGDALV